MVSSLGPRCTSAFQQLPTLSKLFQCRMHTSIRAVPTNPYRTSQYLRLTHRPSPLMPRSQPQPSYHRSFASKPRPSKPSKKPAKPAKPTRSTTLTQIQTTTPTRQPPVLPHTPESAHPTLFTHADHAPAPSLLAHTLASRASPTLLYLAPSSNAYALTCLGVSAFAATYGAWHLYDAYLVPHPGLWWLVPHLMAGVSVFMIGVGVWVGLGARRLVGSLSAVPRTTAAGPGLMLRLEAHRVLPFLPARTLEAPLSDVRLQSAVAPIAAGLEPASSVYADLTGGQARRAVSSAARQRLQEAQRKRERETEPLWKTLTGPPRRVLAAGWKGIGRVVARDGFASVRFGGKTWKLDARDGWLLEEGVALDRLLRGR